MTIKFPRVGERFLDRYEITNVLGAGGMSRVYGAIQSGLDRQVAIKLLAPVGAENLSGDALDKIAQRFEREAKLISRFRSSHTVVMYDYGRSGDYLYMILEYVDGLNLHELVERVGPLPAERVARIVRQALVSLSEAHQMGILHRDIKPQNIMVFEHLGDPDNTKVLDFGIAKTMGETGPDDKKLTEERTIIGTPSYMSPEQILGHELTPASDIYSLGLVAYEMLFGIVAVEADSAVSTMARHLAPTPIVIPDDRKLPPAFLDVIRRMIAKDREHRYESAAHVLAALTAWDGGDPNLTLPRVSGPQPTLDGTPPSPSAHADEAEPATSNRPLAVTAGLLVVGVVVAAVALVGILRMMSEEPEVVVPPVAAIIVEPLSPTPKEDPPPSPSVEPTTDPAEVAVTEAEPEIVEKPVAVKVARKTRKRAEKAAPIDPEPEPSKVAPSPAPEPEPKVAPAPKVAAEPAPVEKPAATKAAASVTTKKKKKKKKKKAPPASF